MNHEPECPVVTFWLPVLAECHCKILRPAYQRGRKDAAEAIKQLETNNYGMLWDRVAIAAAIGVDEQK